MTVFDQYARNYNEGHSKAVKGSGFKPSYFHEYKVKEIFGHLKARNLNNLNLKILNVGCGIGESEPYLKSYLPNSEIYGIDVSEECIEVAREVNHDLKGVTFSAYDGKNIPFNIEFDVIFIANVFHHIRRENHISTLKSIYNKLRNKGVIFLFELNPLNPLTLWIAYQNDYKFDKDSKLLSPFYAKGILSASDFVELKARFTIFFPNFLSSLLRFEKYLYRIPFGAHYYYVAEKSE